MTTSETRDEHAMRLAIAASREALAAGDRPYGATLSDAGGQVRWTARNRQVSSADCTAHAELVLVREASAALGADALRGATVHASGEPCAMCAGALFWAGVRRVVYAVPQETMAALLGGELLPIHAAEVLAGTTPPVQVDGPLLADDAIAVLQEAAARAGRVR